MQAGANAGTSAAISTCTGRLRAPVPPSQSPEPGQVEAVRSSQGDGSDAADASISDLLAGWTKKQVGEWKDRKAWL